jgi:putative transposase
VSYWHLFYHIVTATKNRQPIITPDIEPVMYDYIRSKVSDLQGQIFALNGTEDHIHLVVSIPPALSVAAFIGQIKGFSSVQVNRFITRGGTFAWQKEYSVFSLDRNHLPGCVAYVEKQKEHHRAGTVYPILERTEGNSSGVREEMGQYSVDDLPY